MSTVYFITHPDVVISPTVPVPQWPLSPRGRERMTAVLEHHWASGIRAIYCSTEQKAIDGATIMSDAIGVPYTAVHEFGENDRSATGYLPVPEFEWTAHDQGFAQRGESQVAVQPVACRPAHDPACEQVDDNGQVQPTFAGPHVGDVGAPLLVGPCRREVLVEQVRRDRPSVMLWSWLLLECSSSRPSPRIHHSRVRQTLGQSGPARSWIETS
jgi:hypothetical protein